MGLLWSYCQKLSAQVTESSALGQREVHQSSQNCEGADIKRAVVILYDGFPSKIILVKIACKDAAISVLCLNLQSLKGLDA
ncbi:hypothetical protein QYF36_002306 [Acer negundo]|nr:hypothetical protein QYF36_002306 [Acer negundo]